MDLLQAKVLEYWSPALLPEGDPRKDVAAPAELHQPAEEEAEFSSDSSVGNEPEVEIIRASGPPPSVALRRKTHRAVKKIQLSKTRLASGPKLQINPAQAAKPQPNPSLLPHSAAHPTLPLRGPNTRSGPTFLPFPAKAQRRSNPLWPSSPGASSPAREPPSLFPLSPASRSPPPRAARAASGPARRGQRLLSLAAWPRLSAPPPPPFLSSSPCRATLLAEFLCPARASLRRGPPASPEPPRARTPPASPSRASPSF